MTKSNEADNYIANKKEIFLQLMDAIGVAHSTRKNKIYLKGLKVLEEEVDIVAQKDEWPVILSKALLFFETNEDYEMCQRCQTIKESILTKKQKVDDKDSTKKRIKKT